MAYPIVLMPPTFAIQPICFEKYFLLLRKMDDREGFESRPAPKIFSPSASAATFQPLQRWEISFNGNYL